MAQPKVSNKFLGFPSLPDRDVQMEAGGDPAAPEPGDADDLEDAPPCPIVEAAADGGGVNHTDPPDPGDDDGGLELAGVDHPLPPPKKNNPQWILARNFCRVPLFWGKEVPCVCRFNPLQIITHWEPQEHVDVIE